MNIADMNIHIRKELLPVNKERLQDEIRVLEGVTAARFNSKMNNWLNVLYDPQVISSMLILKQARQWDEEAIVF